MAFPIPILRHGDCVGGAVQNQEEDLAMDDGHGNGIPIERLGLVSRAGLKPIRLSGQQKMEFESAVRSILENAYRRPVDRTGYGDYAQVMAGGKVVATLSNEGFAKMSNALGARVGGNLSNDGSGPELAQRRAEQIAGAVGGTVVKLSSAIDQAAWRNREPIRTAIDFEAMRRDGLIERWQSLGGGAALDAQLLGQAGKG
jgi:hypothetical protein